LPHIFDAFEQGGSGTTRQFGGLGLGLAISKSLVELHGGSIGVRSEGKGKGATFTVRLPEHACALPGFAPRPRTQAGVQVGGTALRILLVEDHGDTAKVMCRFLAGNGHHVQVAGDLAAASRLIAAEHFDLLISDLGLPDGSGLELMRALRSRGESIPGIALSGFGQDQDIRRSHEAGFVTHLTKPASLERIAEAIATATRALRPPGVSRAPRAAGRTPPRRNP
jgi:two-component system CheB/CheR fusion protein